MRRPRIWTGFLLLLAAALLGSACFSIANSESVAAPVAPVDPNATADRTDCNAIFGTSFRSPEERAWFDENCSTWPPVSVPETTPAPAVPPETLARCLAMRGRPYESSETRNWYLQNCGNLPASALGLETPTPDDANCDETRGNNDRSRSGQQGSARNCPSATPTPERDSGPTQRAAPQTDSPAPRTAPYNCALLRRNGYQNAVEREYYLRYCR